MSWFRANKQKNHLQLLPQAQQIKALALVECDQHTENVMSHEVKQKQKAMQ